MIVGVTVIEFRFFNLKKTKKKNFDVAFLLISHTLYNIFPMFFDKRFLLAYSLPEYPQMRTERHSESEIAIFKCTGLMPNDLANPYIQVLAYL